MEKLNARQMKFGAVVLAAGFSSRTKTWKPGILFDNMPLIAHTLVPVANVCRQIVIVGGHRFEMLEPLLRRGKTFGQVDLRKVIFVRNNNFAAGMFSSVKTGIAKVDVSVDGIFVVPADMPFITPRTYAQLTTEFKEEPGVDVFIPGIALNATDIGTEKALKKGHPILLRNRICPSILREPENAVLREVLAKHKSKICPVDDEGIRIDIDNEDDLARYVSFNRSYSVTKAQRISSRG